MNLLKAMSAVSGMTLVSRITGLAREVLTAAWFGAGLVALLATALLRDPGARLANPSAFREGLCSAARHD